MLKEDFAEFEEGEYVGYEIEDTGENTGQTFVYAVIVEKVLIDVSNILCQSVD